MERWYITATVGQLFTQYSVTRMVTGDGEVWTRAGTSQNTATAVVSSDSPEDQLKALGIELYSEASAAPWTS